MTTKRKRKWWHSKPRGNCPPSRRWLSDKRYCGHVDSLYVDTSSFVEAMGRVTEAVDKFGKNVRLREINNK